jgi:hypothetical protein
MVYFWQVYFKPGYEITRTEYDVCVWFIGSFYIITASHHVAVGHVRKSDSMAPA